jgi:hypothetical protein
MAIPLWIPIALAAASAGANYQGQRRVDRARDNAYAANLRKNAEEERKARASAAASRDEYAGFQSKQDEAGKAWADDLKAGQGDVYANVAPSSQAGAVAPTTDRVVADTRTAAQGTRRYTNSLADALGAMRGFDDSMQVAGMAARDNAIDIRRFASNMGGNNRVLNAELNAANGKGRNWGTLGDLLSMAAMVTTPAALAAAPAAGTGATVGATTRAAPLATRQAVAGSLPLLLSAPKI